MLYIEDNPMNLHLMQKIFSKSPYLELRDAHTAGFGIELARDEPPALILMDINLPGMDGFTDYFTKPIDISSLYDALGKLIVRFDVIVLKNFPQ
ncbi:MAG: response regulator [Sulfuricella sp.]|nr:response regulator [Sulfuricella sp.]